MEFTKSILILYGSETGTSEDVAYRVSTLLMRKNIDVNIMNMNEYNVMNLPQERIILFIASTTGDGEVPPNMKSFWSFLLKKGLSSDSLSLLEYSVFGLGDSSYEKFNAAARKLNMRLKQLGAKEIIPIGLGDDQGVYGYFSALDIWLENLWGYLKGKGYTHDINIDNKPILLNQQYTVSFSCLKPEESDVYRNKYYYSRHELGKGDIIKATVLENIRMTSASWNQDVRNIVLDMSRNPQLPSFVGGDVAIVHPKNPNTLTARAISLLKNTELLNGINIDSNLLITCKKLVHDTRSNRIGDIQCTLEDLFSRYLDIGGIPKRGFFEQLSLFATSKDEQDKLLEISSAEGTDLYYDYCVKERRNYVEVMEEFPSARPPLYRLLEMIPILQPRHYSIASSGLFDNTKLELCVALVEYKTRLGRKREGICSGYFSSLEKDDEVILSIRSGSFVAPPISVPLILIGPGTGVAPMRALLQERFINVKNNPESSSDTILFFGCRKQNSDFLFEQDWIDFDSNTNSKIKTFVAFSQDQENKIYVTQKIKENGELLWKLLSQDACIFIAGSAKKMPIDVKKALKEVISKYSTYNEDEAGKILTTMERMGKLCTECWT
jgi:sulfite reductase alpha subunit-like flavoprotein